MFNWLAKLLPSRPQADIRVEDQAARPLPDASALGMKEQGDRCLDNGDWSGAAAYYQQAIVIDPHYANAYNNLGLALVEQGHLTEAAEKIKQAIALDDTLHHAYYILGTIARQNGNLQNALAHFSKATAVNPDFAEAFDCIGDIWAELGESEQAALAHRQAYSLNPQLAMPHETGEVLLPGDGEEADFQIVIIRPAGYMHSQAFVEVAETIYYGLKKLGKKAAISYNTYGTKSKNIILGSNLLSPERIPLVPENSIIYNLEQVYSGSPWITPHLLDLFGRLEIWDYSQRNVESILTLNTQARATYVPIGYVPELSRILPAMEEDIDVLFYGSLNEHRQKILSELTAAGVKVEAVFGVYGAARDALIGRAKLVLNMRLYESDIFEIVRISYLLANKKAVVSECSDVTDIEPDIREAIALAPYSKLVETCLALLENAEKRQSIAHTGFVLMSKRIEEKYLLEVLGNLKAFSDRA